MNSSPHETPTLALLEQNYYNNPMPAGISVPIGMIATEAPGLLQSAAREAHDEYRNASFDATIFARHAEQISAIHKHEIGSAERLRTAKHQIAAEDLSRELTEQARRAYDGHEASLDTPRLFKLSQEVTSLANQDLSNDGDVAETNHTLQLVQANAKAALTRAQGLATTSVLAEEIMAKTTKLSHRARVSTVVGGCITSLSLGAASVYAIHATTESQPDTLATATETAGWTLGGVLAIVGTGLSMALAHKLRDRFAHKRAKRLVKKASSLTTTKD